MTARKQSTKTASSKFAKIPVAEATEVHSEQSGAESLDSMYEAARLRRDAALSALGGYQGIVGFVVGLAASLGASFLVAYAFEYLTIAALMLPGGAVFGMAVYIIGFLLTIYAGMRAGMAAHRWVTSGSASQDMAAIATGAKSLWSKATSFIERKAAPVLA